MKLEFTHETLVSRERCATQQSITNETIVRTWAIRSALFEFFKLTTNCIRNSFRPFQFPGLAIKTMDRSRGVRRDAKIKQAGEKIHVQEGGKQYRKALPGTAFAN